MGAVHDAGSSWSFRKRLLEAGPRRGSDVARRLDPPMTALPDLRAQTRDALIEGEAEDLDRELDSCSVPSWLHLNNAHRFCVVTAANRRIPVPCLRSLRTCDRKPIGCSRSFAIGDAARIGHPHCGQRKCRCQYFNVRWMDRSHWVAELGYWASPALLKSFLIERPTCRRRPGGLPAQPPQRERRSGHSDPGGTGLLQ